MDDIACGNCTWSDSRPSTNSRLATCDNCGGDQLVYTAPQADVPPAPEPPVQVPVP